MSMLEGLGLAVAYEVQSHVETSSPLFNTVYVPQLLWFLLGE